MRRLRWQAEWAWLFAVLVLLVLGYRWFPDPEGSNLDTFSSAAGGKRAFFTVCERLTPPVTRTMESFYDYSDRADTLCILGPARYPDTEEWLGLSDWVADGNSLVFAARLGDPAVELKYFGIRVLPNERMVERRKKKEKQQTDPPNSTTGDATDEPATDPQAKQDTRDRTSETVTSRPSRSLFSEPEVHTTLGSGQFHWQSAGHIESSHKGAEVLVSWNGQPQVVRQAFGQGTVIVCSSDYVFSNQSLASDDNGQLAFRILEVARSTGVAFDESLNASGAPKVFGLLFEPHVRPITLQILVVVVLFGWYGFRRFGPLLIEAGSEHRSMTEHAVALGNLHWKSSTGGRALSSYLEYFRSELRLHYATGPTMTEAALLARRAGIDEQATANLLNEARQVAQMERVSGSRVAAIVRQLAAIKSRLEHAKGA